MQPEIASFGSLTIHSYGLLIALGIFSALTLMNRQAKREGFPPAGRVSDLVFAAVFSGFLGGRLFYVIQEGAFYRENPLAVFKIWEGGLIFSGGMLTGLLGLFIYARMARLPFLQVNDFVITYVPWVHTFGRVGCFLNGCCYGKPSLLPWAVQFPFLQTRVHPVQLYEALFTLGLFGFLFWFYPRRRFPGELVGLYFILYPAGRFLLEFFRAGRPFLGGLTFQQVLALQFIGLGLIGYLFCRRKFSHDPSHP